MTNNEEPPVQDEQLPEVNLAVAADAKTATAIDLLPVNSLSIAGLIRDQPRWPETDPRFRALVADIKERGVREPIWVDEDGVVWDGFDRLRASKAAGLRTIPARRCKSSDGPDIAFGSLVHRKQLTKSQLVYSAHPYFIGRVEVVRARNAARLASGGVDIVEKAAADTVESLCAELGVSRQLWYQAEAVHDAFVTRPDLRALFEPQIMDADAPISLGQAIAGIAGHLSTKGKEKRQTLGGKSTLLISGLRDTSKRFKFWEQLGEDELNKVCKEIRNTVERMPDGLMAEFARTIRATEKARKAAKAGAPTDPSDN